jgi:hypothetical protein
LCRKITQRRRAGDAQARVVDAVEDRRFAGPLKSFGGGRLRERGTFVLPIGA